MVRILSEVSPICDINSVYYIFFVYYPTKGDQTRPKHVGNLQHIPSSSSSYYYYYYYYY